MKPGYQTTEFWITAAIQLVGALVALGLLTTGQADAANKIIGIVASLLGMLLSGAAYTASRTVMKMTADANSTTSKVTTIAVLLAGLFLFAGTAQAETQYERMYAAAVEADKPLLVCVGISEDAAPVPMGSDLFVCVDKLEGYSAGDVVWSAPRDGKLLHVKTMNKPTLSQVVSERPKRVAFGCETGKCSYSYFPGSYSPALSGSCQGGTCSGPASCAAGGVCSSCTKCTATSTPATLRNIRTVQAAGSCPNCPK